MDTFLMTGIEIVVSEWNSPPLPIIWDNWPFVWKPSNYMLQRLMKERMQRKEKHTYGPPVDNDAARLWSLKWTENITVTHLVGDWVIFESTFWVLYYKLENYSLPEMKMAE